MGQFKNFLTKQSALKALPADQIEILESYAELKRLSEGDILFQTGQSANYFYIIHSGRMDLLLYSQERGPQKIKTLKKGEILGFSWIVPPYKWQFDSKAPQEAEVLAFRSWDIRKECEQNPSLHQNLLELFIGVLHNRLSEERKMMSESNKVIA